jgi:hypothetical protein
MCLALALVVHLGQRLGEQAGRRARRVKRPANSRPDSALPAVDDESAISPAQQPAPPYEPRE